MKYKGITIKKQKQTQANKRAPYSIPALGFPAWSIWEAKRLINKHIVNLSMKENKEAL